MFDNNEKIHMRRWKYLCALKKSEGDREVGVVDSTCTGCESFFSPAIKVLSHIIM